LIPGSKWSITYRSDVFSGEVRETLRNRLPLRPLVFLAAALLAFALLSPAADIPCVWSGVERIVAVGDLHGDYDNFVTILKNPKVGLLDENLRWIGGKTHLVQIGDILDRGDKAKDIFDLLMRLEKEAAAAGGMVHVLLGNHEETTLTGIALSYPEYVYVDQFFAFLPEAFKEAREKEYVAQQSPEEQARIKAQGLDLRKDAGWRGYWEKILEKSKRSKGLDEAGQAYTENFNKTYGRWVLKKNVVIKINDVIFVHGGINLRYSTWKLKDLNDAFRLELEVFALRPFNPQLFGTRFHPKLVYNSENPLWLREDEQNTSQEQMDRILVNLKASRMVIGHNFLMSGDGRSPIASPGDVVPLFGGKLWMIDTGIGYTLYGGRLYALIIKDGEFDHYAEAEEPVPASPEAPQAREGPRSPDEIEKYLRIAAPLFVVPGEAGRTDPWKVRMDFEGIRRWAQFKYIDRPRPNPIPDSYKYELAACALSKYLGLGFVPPVVERTIKDYPGSLQIFIEDALRESDRKRQNTKLDDQKSFDEAMADLRVFINLVYDRCDTERDRDILIQRGTGKIFAVDFSRAFDTKNETVPGCEILRCSRIIYKKLLNWNQDQVGVLLGPYLNEGEMRALHARVGSILRMIRRQIETKGEGAVLF
jgi:hypothetical protein